MRALVLCPQADDTCARHVPCVGDGSPALRREVLALRTGRGERAFTDELSGAPTYYLFMDRGKLLSDYYLFTTPLRTAIRGCQLAHHCRRAAVSDVPRHENVHRHLEAIPRARQP
jgi:hypothetical protein